MSIRGQIAGYIQTYSGGVINPLDPDLEDISIDDIAHALACQCRFTGHIKFFYSVAQHCVLVSSHCDPEDALWGLLHDAAEAYMADIARPLKKYSTFGKQYLETEAKLMEAICEKFGLVKGDMPPSVRKADDLLLRAEANSLLKVLRPEIWKDWDCSPVPGLEIKPWTWEESEYRFLRRFDQLTGK